MYSLYLDKPVDFVCEVAVKNASLKNAFARMVVNANDTILMFEGILKDGKCTVPIKRLKGLLDESTSGKMYLEVIVEDTYFKPWNDDFKIEQHTDVKIKMQEQIVSSKPVVEVKSVSPSTKCSPPAADLIYICERMGITRKNLLIKKNVFKEILREYFKTNPEFLKKRKLCISEAVNALK